MPEKTKPTYTPRKKDGAVRMENTKGFQYWVRPEDVERMKQGKKPWKLVPDPPDGKYGPTGPPRKES